MSIRTNKLAREKAALIEQMADEEIDGLPGAVRERFWGVLMERAVRHLSSVPPRVQELLPMTPEEVREFRKELVPMGNAYRGQPVGDVPYSYWLNFERYAKFRMKLHRYLSSDTVQRELPDVPDYDNGYQQGDE